MAKHIYVSVGKFDPKDGKFKTPKGRVTPEMNYRGLADGEHDDPNSYAKKLWEKQGLMVMASDKPIPEFNKVVVANFEFVIKYPECWDDKMSELFPPEESTGE